jgi:lipoate---protein ligase
LTAGAAGGRTAWTVEIATGPASAFQARPLPDPVTPSLWVLRVDRPALVLGSTQSAAVVDRSAVAAGDVEVVRRRSGGGAVLLTPGTDLWIDVLLPRQDPRWNDDVGRAAHWLGEVWAVALATAAAVTGPVVHRGPLVRRPWSDLVCFAGLGSGEVTDGPGGPKVVGISQRRTRDGARFQCAVTSAWRPATMAGLLALGPADRDRLAADLQGAVRPVEDLATVEQAFLHLL